MSAPYRVLVLAALSTPPYPLPLARNAILLVVVVVGGGGRDAFSPVYSLVVSSYCPTASLTTVFLVLHD